MELVYVALALVVSGVAALFLLRGSKGPKVALKAGEFITVPLAEKIVISHDTRIFRFALPSKEHVLGLPIGQHVALKATVNGDSVLRSYTPISSDDDKGHIDLLVKVYFANVHPKFPDGGKMSQHLESLKVGDTILMKGPNGRFEYLGNGKCTMRGKEKSVKHFGMIAGGTGLTPVLQVLRAILKDPSDTTTVHLLYANQTEEDILLREELDKCAQDSRVKVWYTLDRPTEGWQYSKGFIDYDMVEARMPVPSPDTMILMCGPPPMLNFACVPNLEKRGFQKEEMVTF